MCVDGLKGSVVKFLVLVGGPWQGGLVDVIFSIFIQQLTSRFLNPINNKCTVFLKISDKSGFRIF